MALARLSKSMKICGTCNYWTGPRRMDNMWAPTCVIVEGKGYEEIGKCSHRYSGWFAQVKKANGFCRKWELLAAWRR